MIWNMQEKNKKIWLYARKKTKELDINSVYFYIKYKIKSLKKQIS